MDKQITAQIKWLLSNNGNTARLGRALLTLVGFLVEGTMPTEIERQTTLLSHLVVLQEMFDTLTTTLNSLCRQPTAGWTERAPINAGPVVEPQRLLDQIESVRRDLASHDPVNYALITAWVVGQAKLRNIPKARERR